MDVYSFSLEISKLRMIIFSVIHLIVFFFFFYLQTLTTGGHVDFILNSVLSFDFMHV